MHYQEMVNRTDSK